MLHPTFLIRDKYIYDIIDIQFSHRTTCWGKYIPDGIDIYHVLAKGKLNAYKEDLPFAFSLPELNREVNLLGHK